eukprot:2304105-Amphidinium_carterae.1
MILQAGTQSHGQARGQAICRLQPMLGNLLAQPPWVLRCPIKNRRETLEHDAISATLRKILAITKKKSAKYRPKKKEKLQAS